MMKTVKAISIIGSILTIIAEFSALFLYIMGVTVNGYLLGGLVLVAGAIIGISSVMASIIVIKINDLRSKRIES